MQKEELPQSSDARLPNGQTGLASRCHVSDLFEYQLEMTYSKERIEVRGPIAKDVNLDVQIFKPKVKQNLLESIILGKRSKCIERISETSV